MSASKSVSTLASKINVSKIITKNSASFNKVFSESQRYPSVTKILSVLTEGKFATWQQNVVLNSFMNQIILLQKKQPHRVFSMDDLNLLKRVAESSPQQELQKKGVVGNESHALLNKLILGKDIPEEKKYASFLSGYQLWKKTHNVDIYFTDVFVRSDKYKFCGFIDAIGMQEDGSIVVIDFKTGNKVYSSYAFQVAAYCKAFEEYYDASEPVANATILHLNPENPEFHFLKVDDVDTCFSYFLHCKELYQLRQTDKSFFSDIALLVC